MSKDAAMALAVKAVATDAVARKNESIFAQFAWKFIERGISVVPIAPGTKKPGQWSQEHGWRGMGDWTRFAKRLPTELELEHWEKWPDAGIGVVLGPVSNLTCLDKDYDIPNGGDDALLAIIPYSPIAKKGEKGWTRFYQFSGERSCSFDVGGARVLDVLAEGRQTVVPPTMHPSGCSYVWITEEGLDSILSTNELPKLPPDFLEQVALVLAPYQNDQDIKHQKKTHTPKDDDRKLDSDLTFSAQYFRDLNQRALSCLDDWVPKIVPLAKHERDGYRTVATWRGAKNLNVGITSQGIRDWGGNYGMTPIDLVMWANGLTFAQAAVMLRQHVQLAEPEPIVMTVRGVVEETPVAVVREAAGSSLPPSNLPMADWIAAFQQKKPPATFEFVPAGDLVREPQPVEYLVDELIEHPSLMMLFGAPSAGKSFVAISMTACVATGHPWLGRDVRAGTVFYLAGEGHAGLSRRLRAWEIETGVSLDGAPLFVSKLPAQLMDAENAQMVERAINALAAIHGLPVLIVIDTLARNMGSGDESSNADIGKFVAHIDGMRHRLGCTVQLVHHSGHLETERARGASALPAAMDTSFQMEDKSGVRSLTQKKSKESELAAPIPLTLKEVPIGWKDAKGREINSAVIALANAGEHAIPAGKPMPQSQQDAMQTFYAAAVEKGVETDGRVGVHLETWRPHFYKTCSADSQDAKRQAFNRVRGALVKSGVLRLDFDTYSVDATDIGYVSNRLVKNMTVTP